MWDAPYNTCIIGVSAVPSTLLQVSLYTDDLSGKERRSPAGEELSASLNNVCCCQELTASAGTGLDGNAKCV